MYFFVNCVHCKLCWSIAGGYQKIRLQSVQEMNKRYYIQQVIMRYVKFVTPVIRVTALPFVADFYFVDILFES